MTIPSLKELAFAQTSFKQAIQADATAKGVLTQICLKKIAEIESMECFNESLQEVQGHPCILVNFSVWHGSLLGPRKFRKKTLCQCKCKRLGVLCECDCGCVFRMIMEFREAEIFRGYRLGQTKHKKCPRFISKKTKLERLLEAQFEDTLPRFTSL